MAIKICWLKSFANEDDQSWRPRGCYARPLNIDLSWDQDDLSDIQSIQGIPVHIPMEKLKQQQLKWNLVRLQIPPDVATEMEKQTTMRVLPQLFTLPIKLCLEKKTPEDWSKLITITRYKGEGDPLFRDNYRSLKLFD